VSCTKRRTRAWVASSHLNSFDERLAKDSKALSRFRREAKAASAIKRPNSAQFMTSAKNMARTKKI
jgi:hypothetical protein